jgi:transcriptional regulator with PAS, ATPase and Fis domain
VPEAIEKGKFREDLYYRLNTVPIYVPPLRDRKEDIVLLFRKFASDFAEKYRMPAIQLSEDAREMLMNFRWPGNVRQLKNITEQISIIEKNRDISGESLLKYLPQVNQRELPVLYKKQQEQQEQFSEREILYKVLFDMKQDITDMKQLVLELMENPEFASNLKSANPQLVKRIIRDVSPARETTEVNEPDIFEYEADDPEPFQESEVIEENLSLQKKEEDMIRLALEKHQGKRKPAARELGISERTLYRKIREYDIR